MSSYPHKISHFKNKRIQGKSKIQNEAERLEKLLLESLAKEQIVKQALGDPEKLNLSPTKISKPKFPRTEERDDMFKLPPLKEENGHSEIKSELDDEDDEDLCPKRSYDVNINQIDVTSAQFLALPADIRHDILTDIKETRKQNSWGRLRELPVESNDFSSYQMSRLLRRRQVQVSMEEAEKEMGGKTWSLSELEALLSEDGVLDPSSKHAQKIASDENTRFLLVRDIAKAMKEAKEAGPSTSKAFKASSPEPSTSKQSLESLDDEDYELQRAIQLSLGNNPDELETETVPTDSRVKMNAEQRQKFSGTIQAHGLIRGFMMEYAEMNDTDIQDLMEATQTPAETELTDSFRSRFPNTDDYVLYGTPKKNHQIGENNSLETAESLPDAEKVYAISDNDSDDDLVEVQEEPKVTLTEKVVITLEPGLMDFSQEEDLFADIFKSPTEETSEKQKQDHEEVPDVEVASISSDDDTLPYEVLQNDLNDLDKEIESCFVSEEGKLIETSQKPVEEASKLPEIVEDTVNEIPLASENDKFWEEVDEPVVEPAENVAKQTQEFSENDKFWDDEQIEISDDIIQITDKETKQLTPSKIGGKKSPQPAQLASPFFVNRKTPKSKEKNVKSVDVDASSATKSLFKEPTIDKDTVLREAAQELKSNKTSEELEQMKDQLVDEQKNLAHERNRMDRMGMSITESMSRDCKDLLKLFGIPYIESPMEAEAQCAFLNMINLTDGTISDDSDIWLFGGQTVYKNFFVQKKIVMEFRSENIDQMFHLDRKKLIQLAMLVGSDYTVGLNGVGAVTALEILAAFPVTPESEDGTDQYQSVVSSLRKFREWFQNGKESGPGGRTVLKSKLKNIELIEGFPNLNVARAYLDPVIDSNAEKFSWGMLDKESLVEYAKAKLGWTRLKTEEILSPVLKRLNEKKQATIKDYFKSQVSKKFFDNNMMSKRVQKAVGKMGGYEDVDEKEKEKPKKTRKRKASVKKNEKKVDEENLVLVLSDEDEDSGAPAEKKSSPETSKVVDDDAKPRTSSNNVKKPNTVKSQKPKAAPRKRKPKENEPSTSSEAIPIKKHTPRIPNTKQVIPQQEKDKEEMEKTKKKAIEIFKKSVSKKK